MDVGNHANPFVVGSRKRRRGIWNFQGRPMPHKRALATPRRIPAGKIANQTKAVEDFNEGGQKDAKEPRLPKPKYNTFARTLS